MSYPLTYSLFVKASGKYEPVTDPNHLKIEKHIRAADPSPAVASVAAADLHRHVNAVPWPFPIEGHLIQLDRYEQSRWNPIIKDWQDFASGASNIYKVYAENSSPDNATLFLQASVEAGLDSDDSTTAGA